MSGYRWHMVQGGPQIPSPLLANIGKGRMGRFRRMVVLERFDGRSWTRVARFGSTRAADVALDEALARGEQPDRLRVTETGPSPASRLATILVAIVAVALIALWTYVSFSPS